MINNLVIIKLTKAYFNYVVNLTIYFLTVLTYPQDYEREI